MEPVSRNVCCKAASSCQLSMHTPSLQVKEAPQLRQLVVPEATKCPLIENTAFIRFKVAPSYGLDLDLCLRPVNVLPMCGTAACCPLHDYRQNLLS